MNWSQNKVTISENYADYWFGELKDIDLAMRDLKSEVKVPFMMHFEGFKYQEIAEELDLPLGTVKSRIFIARKELQESLKAYAV